MSRGRDTERELELAGIDLSESGPFFRPRGITVTDQVEIVESDLGPALKWRDVYDDLFFSAKHSRDDTNGALAGFVGLENAPAKQFLRFARSWGPLSLCEHGKPASHNRPTFPEAPASYHCRAVNPEPLYLWNHYVRQASALVRIIGHLYREKRPPAEEWRTVYEWSESPNEAPWWNSTVEADRLALSLVLREWVELANLRPVPALWDDRSRMELEFDIALFGAVARDLLFLAVRADRLTTCAECGTFYVPKRRPAAGRRSFCFRCRKLGAPGKHSSRAYRSRRKS